MTITQKSLAKQSLKCSPKSRIELAEELLASVENFTTPEIQAAWDAEIGARAKEISDGHIEGIPADTVMAKARQKLNEARDLSSLQKRHALAKCPLHGLAH